jgi:transcription initiation factor IIE alpha subunit
VLDLLLHEIENVLLQDVLYAETQLVCLLGVLVSNTIGTLRKLIDVRLVDLKVTRDVSYNIESPSGVNLVTLEYLLNEFEVSILLHNTIE